MSNNSKRIRLSVVFDLMASEGLDKPFESVVSKTITNDYYTMDLNTYKGKIERLYPVVGDRMVKEILDALNKSPQSISILFHYLHGYFLDQQKNK